MVLSKMINILIIRDELLFFILLKILNEMYSKIYIFKILMIVFLTNKIK
jgi:hypothetical protein